MIAIIGSNSFSGSNFADYCLSRGHDVLAFSRSPESHGVFLKYKTNENKSKLTFFQKDLNIELDDILQLLSVLKPEYIANFAAQGMVAESWDNPEHWFKTNLVAQVNLHKALVGKSWLKKYLHVGTPEVYGSSLYSPSTVYPTTEESELVPSTPYAVSRAACDMSLRTFVEQYKFPVVTTRSANVYGSGQQLYRIIPKAIMCGMTGATLPLDGGGKSCRSFVHIQDVCRVSYELLEAGVPGEILNIPGDDYLSIKELVDKISSVAGLKIKTDEVKERPGKDKHYFLKTSNKMHKFINLECGIRETYEWIKDNFHTLKRQSVVYQHKE